jgi:hypothetical protein
MLLLCKCIQVRRAVAVCVHKRLSCVCKDWQIVLVLLMKGCCDKLLDSALAWQQGHVLCAPFCVCLLLQGHLEQRPHLLLPLLLRLHCLDQQISGSKQRQQQQQARQLLAHFKQELLGWIPTHIVAALQQEVKQRLPLSHQQLQRWQQYRGKQQQQQGETLQPPSWQAQVRGRIYCIACHSSANN